MSHVVLCDACGQICQNQQFFALSAWHGKGAYVPAQRKQDPGWEIKLRDDVDGLSADVCCDCMRDRIGLSSFQLVKTREAKKLELEAKMSGLTLLRHLAGGSYSVAVTCDKCGAECMERHLRIKSVWLTAAGEESMAELCEGCVQSQLQPIVTFQQTPQKATPQAAAV